MQKEQLMLLTDQQDNLKTELTTLKRKCEEQDATGVSDDAQYDEPTHHNRQQAAPVEVRSMSRLWPGAISL